MNAEHKLITELLDKDKLQEDTPHCWIQWKGTEVCLDFHCLCGYHGHFDGEFFYFTKCPKCGKVYSVGQNVKLYELTNDEIKLIEEQIKTQELLEND